MSVAPAPLDLPNAARDVKRAEWDLATRAHAERGHDWIRRSTHGTPKHNRERCLVLGHYAQGLGKRGFSHRYARCVTVKRGQVTA